MVGIDCNNEDCNNSACVCDPCDCSHDDPCVCCVEQESS
jgi:hypothetical protein